MNSINWDAAKVFSDLFQWLVMCGFAVYAWWTRRHSDSAVIIRGINERIDLLDKHVGQLDQTLQHRPGHDDLDQLRAELSQNNRRLAEVSAQLNATSQLLNRLHDYLLNEKGNR